VTAVPVDQEKAIEASQLAWAYSICKFINMQVHASRFQVKVLVEAPTAFITKFLPSLHSLSPSPYPRILPIYPRFHVVHHILYIQVFTLLFRFLG
jgi:hypothetical protein